MRHASNKCALVAACLVPAADAARACLPVRRWCAAMNEATWQQVALWEKLHAKECDCPTLLKFQGKPHDLR